MTLVIRVIVAMLVALSGPAHACDHPPVPPRPVHATLAVSSGLTPSGAKDRISITVADHFNGLSSTPLAVAQSVQTIQADNGISITAVLLDPCVPGNPEGPVDVDLGLLPPGRYSVSYSSNAVNLDLHKASLKFLVADSGATTPWPSVTAVEYYHAALDRYFITADPGEIEALDQGTIRGWSRTGEVFPVYPPDGIPIRIRGGGVCRMYGLPEAGLDSHFFSIDTIECDAVLKRWPFWILEQAIAFGGAYPDGGFPDGYYCSEGKPLFRLYSNRPGADHRYTVRVEIRDTMIARGWIVEGRFHLAGGSHFAMCVPP